MSYRMRSNGTFDTMKRYIWWIVGSSFICCIILGWIGFELLPRKEGEIYTHWDNIYLSFQLFVLQSGDVRNINNPFLHIARFMAPLTLAYATFLTILRIFHEEWKLLQIRRLDGHVVICGAGNKGLYIMQHYLRQNKRIVLIEPNRDQSEIVKFESKNLAVLMDDATDDNVLKKANVQNADELYAMTGDDEINIDIASTAYELVKRTKPHNKSGKKRVLKTFIHIFDPKVKELLETNYKLFNEPKDNFEASIFNVTEIGARRVLHKHIPELFSDHGDTRNPHIVLFGLGWTGESVLLRAAEFCQYPNGKKLAVTVFDRDDQRHAMFLSKYPFIRDYLDIVFHRVNIETLTSESFKTRLIGRRDPSLVFICIGNELSGVNIALRFKTDIYTGDVPVIVFTTQKTDFHKYIQESDLFKNRAIEFYPIVDESCSYLLKRPEKLDGKADYVHRKYLASAGQGTSLAQEWEMLPEGYKIANRDQVEHIPYKIYSLGLTIEREPTDNAYKLSDEDKNILAQIEHRRWMVERYIAGWRPGGIEENGEIKKDEKNKLNPNLIHWSKLPNNIKKFDHDAVEEIPKILEDEKKRICKPTINKKE